MKDQQQWLIKQNIFAILLISIVIVQDVDIENYIDKKKYLVVFGLPKLPLGP